MRKLRPMSERDIVLAKIAMRLRFPTQWRVLKQYGNAFDTLCPTGESLAIRGHGILGVEIGSTSEFYSKCVVTGLKGFHLRRAYERVRYTLLRREYEEMPESIKNLCHFNGKSQPKPTVTGVQAQLSAMQQQYRQAMNDLYYGSLAKKP